MNINKITTYMNLIKSTFLFPKVIYLQLLLNWYKMIFITVILYSHNKSKNYFTFVPVLKAKMHSILITS